ncbi:T9SS type A sorting domain-containing protein [bacterium]|nr:T9SS type A sorting domain-containing protein [bacterium]MBU1984365.1 T9SS type A sorting domain-containing protein [bacterium]
MNRIHSYIFGAAVTAALSLLLCPLGVQGQPLFEDVAPQLGLDITGACGAMFWYDYDDDGDLDMLQGRRFGGDTYIYRNDGDHFTRLEGIGLPEDWDAAGSVPMDFDHDGDLDHFFGCYHTNNLFLVNQGGSFTDRTYELGLDFNGCRDTKWVDFNNDGWMDILYNHYTEGFKIFRNDAGNDFADITSQLPLPQLNSVHRIAEADVDLDGDIDLFVSQMSQGDCFLLNQGGGVYEDATVASGLHLARAEGGCAWVDFDHDKYPDLLTQGNGRHTIWHNDRDGTFTEMTVHGTETDFSIMWPFAADYAIADFDMDGDHDFYACRPGGCGVYLAPNQFFIQDSLVELDIWFHNVAPDFGMDYMADGYPTVADFDRDGDMDLFITSQDQPSRLFRNNTNQSHFLEVRVLGPHGEQDRWLTRVELYPHGQTNALRVSELSSSNVNRNGLSNYFVTDENGHYDLRIFFACGTVMEPEDYPMLSDVVPSAIGHRLTVYMAQPSAVNPRETETPQSHELGVPYPNPFNGSTTIPYALSTNEAVRIVVYNVHGQRVRELVNGRIAAGHHEIIWNASGHSSGVYFVVMDAGTQTDIRKVLFAK